MTSAADTRFEQLVFSGGGTRCFWQGGFLHVLRHEIVIHPERIASVSGGALSAACFITHRGVQMRDRMIAAFADQDANVTWHDLTDGEHGVTPHQRVYREVVTDVIDAEAQRQIAECPAYQALIAHPQDDDWAKLAGTLTSVAYEAELHLRSTPHLDWSERAGLETRLVDARKAAAEGTLPDLLCAAATIPPVFEPPMWDGRPVVDAGMADKAPMPDPDEGRTLVLLTRRYRNLPDVPGRVYASPSREVPADKIDFTDPGKLRRSWELGERDARRFLDDNKL